MGLFIESTCELLLYMSYISILPLDLLLFLECLIELLVYGGGGAVLLIDGGGGSPFGAYGGGGGGDGFCLYTSVNSNGLCVELLGVVFFNPLSP